MTLVAVKSRRFGVSVLGDDVVVGLRVPHEVLRQQRREVLQRLFDQVLQLGLEVWREEDEYVFRRPTYPPVNRAAHARRHEWLKSVGQGGAG